MSTSSINVMKDKWARGEATVGGWCSLGNAVSAEIMGRAGFDFVCVDNQHGVNDYLTTVSMLQALDLGGATPIVRVPWNEPGIIGKMLDGGSMGIIIPMVNSAAEAEAAVRACRYAPVGARSYGPIRAGMRVDGYFDLANDAVACIPMIETVQAVEALDDILSVPGIDAVYVGPADLSITLGLPPGNNDNDPSFVEALETIVAGCERHGVVAGIHASTALTQQRLEMGFRMVVATSDGVAMRDGLAAAVAQVPGSTTSTEAALY